MANALRREEILERAQLENRDMDDIVLVGKRAHKSQCYHEIDGDGTPKCRVSFKEDETPQQATRREAIEKYTLAPCGYPGCQKSP